MKNVKKNNKKFVIDMTKLESYDDAVIAIVEGYIDNGVPVTKYLFEEYRDIIELNTVLNLMDTVRYNGNTIRFDENGFEICYTDKLELNDGDGIKVKNDEVVVKRSSLFKRFFNIFKRN